MSALGGWDDASRLVKQLGREDYLAGRIAELRRERGWSQDRLAREMAAAGCPLPQSAISKIEKPGPGGRRAITVDELIAFSRVFDIPLAELVLPPHVLADQELLDLFARGPLYLQQVWAAQDAYAVLVQRLAAGTSGVPRWDLFLRGGLERRRQEIEHAKGAEDEDLQRAELQFLEALTEARAAK